MRGFRNVRGRGVLALLALVAAALLAVPGSGGAQTLGPAANGVIRVTVAFGGQPLANMAVLVNNSASDPNPFNNFNGANVTDAGGAYEVAVPPGNYDVHVAELAPHNNENYGSQVLYEVGVGDGAFVPVGFDLNRPGGAIVGTVRDGAGNPVPGVKVEAFGSFALGDPPPYGWATPSPTAPATSGSDRLLPNKWYVVFVSALGYRMDQVPVSAGVTTTGANFPNAVYPGAGAPGGGAPGGRCPRSEATCPWSATGTATARRRSA